MVWHLEFKSRKPQIMALFKSQEQDECNAHIRPDMQCTFLVELICETSNFDSKFDIWLQQWNTAPKLTHRNRERCTISCRGILHVWYSAINQNNSITLTIFQKKGALKLG